MTHCRSEKLPPRSCWIFGSAVFTTVMSSKSMKVATQTAPSVHHFLLVWTPAIRDLLRVVYNS